MGISLVEAIDMVTDASVQDVTRSIIEEYGEDRVAQVADELAWLAVMLKHGGDND